MNEKGNEFVQVELQNEIVEVRRPLRNEELGDDIMSEIASYETTVIWPRGGALTALQQRQWPFMKEAAMLTHMYVMNEVYRELAWRRQEELVWSRHDMWERDIVT